MPRIMHSKPGKQSDETMWNRMSSANNTVNSSIRSQSWSFESCLPDRITRRYNRCNDLSCSDWGSRNGKVEILNSAESKVASGSEEYRSARERSGRRRRLEELRLHFGSKDAGGGSVQATLNSDYVWITFLAHTSFRKMTFFLEITWTFVSL